MNPSSPLHAWAIGLAVAVAVLAVRELGGVEPAELAIYDAFARGARATEAPGDEIVILHLTEQNLRELGHWPLSDRDLAAGLERVIDHGARVVGLDIYRDLPVPPGERHLASILREQRRIIAVHKFGTVEGVPGPWPLREGHEPEREGFNDVIPDRDGSVRRALLFQDDGRGGPVDYAFALRVALAALADEGIAPTPSQRNPEWMQLAGATLVPFESRDGGYGPTDDRGYQLLLNFARWSGGFESFDLVSLLDGRVDPATIRDRIVMVGSNAPSLRDFFRIPPGARGHGISGIELHAVVAQQLLDLAHGRSEPMIALAGAYGALLTGLLALLGAGVGALTERLGLGLTGFAMAILLGVAAWFALGAVAFSHSLWLPTAAPALAWVGASIGVLVETRRPSRSHDESRQRTPASTAAPHTEPRRIDATILAVALHRDTASDTKLSPRLLAEWTHGVLGPLRALVQAHDGVLDHIASDGLRAGFGVREPARNDEQRRRDARRAAACAVAMASAVERTNRAHRERDLPGARLCIGLHSGSVVDACLADGGARMLMGSEATEAQRLASGEAPPPGDAQAVRVRVSGSTAAHLGDAVRVERAAGGKAPCDGHVLVLPTPDGDS